MPPARIEPVDIAVDVGPGGADAVVDLEIHAFVLDAAPQALHEHIVAPCSTSIHRQLAAPIEDGVRELVGGELAALIGADDLRRAMAGEGLLDHLPGMAKIELQSLLSDLGMRGRQIDGLGPLCPSPEHIGRMFQQLPPPLRDLVGVQLKLRGPFGQCLVLAQSRQRDTSLALRIVGAGSTPP